MYIFAYIHVSYTDRNTHQIHAKQHSKQECWQSMWVKFLVQLSNTESWLKYLFLNFPIFKGGDRSTFLMQLLWGLSELIPIEASM